MLGLEERGAVKGTCTYTHRVVFKLAVHAINLLFSTYSASSLGRPLVVIAFYMDYTILAKKLYLL